MTPEEKIESMEQSVTQIERDVAEIKSALLGNPLSGDKGLTGQIVTLHAKQEIQESQIKALIEERVKNTVYIKIINWLLGAVIAGSITLIFNLFKK